jgi:3-dehydroquinate synthetase
MTRTRSPAHRRDPAAADPIPPASEGTPVVEIIAARQGEHSYPIHVGRRAVRALGPLLEGVDRVALVTSRRVLRTPIGTEVAGWLQGGEPLTITHLLADGEKGKTLAELERAAVALLQAGCTRRSLVVALGGGTVTDAGGFLAATFMRGIPWIAMPTTLLAMVDAAIGGKTAVNLPVSKNAVGAFHPPRAVLADPAALESLPPRELASGKGELLKHGMLYPRLLTPFAEGCAGRIVDPAVIAASIRMKVDVVADDPTEQGPRKLLNLGHTFGHGVEAAGRFSRYTHGEAVAVGLAFAFRLARRMGRVGDAAVEVVEAALRRAELPTRIPASLARAAARLMAFDKKRVSAGLRWVLPRAQGDAWVVEWDVEAGAQEVQDTILEVAAPPRGKGAAGAAARRAR